MDIKEKLRCIHANSFYGLGLSPNDMRDIITVDLEKRRNSVDTINSYINEIIRKQRDYTEKSLAEIVEKYDFIVCSTESMNMLEEALPEGAKIAYSPYIGDSTTIYVIKKFDMMDLLDEAIKKEEEDECKEV